MKYFKLCSNHDNKCFYLKNQSTLQLMRDYFSGEILERKEIFEISTYGEGDNRNKYLKMKNVAYLCGMIYTFATDDFAKSILEKEYGDYIRFLPAFLIDDTELKTEYYVLYFNHFIEGIDMEKSVVKFLEDDIYSVNEQAELLPVFRFNKLKQVVFVDETFKNFIEENHIEGWVFREAFESSI